MSDDLFPSGPWEGFYNYTPRDKHHMELALEFRSGRITGEGRDDIGRFTIQGGYDAAALETWWTKSYSYPSAHSVAYRGFREGKGIWGTWEIASQARGGFHIWPVGEGAGETHAEPEVVAAPADAPKPEPVLATAGECGIRSPKCQAPAVSRRAANGPLADLIGP